MSSQWFVFVILWWGRFFFPLTCTVNPTWPSANLPVTHMDIHTEAQANVFWHHVTILYNRVESSYIRYWHCSSPQQRLHCSLSLWCVSECRNKVYVFRPEEHCCPFCSLVEKTRTTVEETCPAESWRHCSHVYFLHFQPWKNWRRQQCFSASLGWPLDISDTSRCVRCFNVIFVFG